MSCIQAVNDSSLEYVRTLANYTYPIVWWIVLPAVDWWNYRRSGLSMWRGNGFHFLGIVLPASTIVWLFFELLNLPAPQWRYGGDIGGMWPKVLFGFVAFATVIPIMVESWWLVAGRRQCLPAEWLKFCREHARALLVLAVVFAAIPFFNDVFWFNQGMWLIPALVLLPFTPVEECGVRPFGRAIVLSGLLAGLAWESINYPARTHWEYLILPDWPHLFHMPVLGYLGFIPFALSMLAVYQYLQTLKPTWWLVALLYGVAFAGLYWLTGVYVEQGLWRSNS